MSSTYANASIPSRPAGTPWLIQVGHAVRRALEAAVSVRPSQGLHEMAARCERLQPALARELRAAAARTGEG
jgi:hypothetical protein